MLKKFSSEAMLITFICLAIYMSQFSIWTAIFLVILLSLSMTYTQQIKWFFANKCLLVKMFKKAPKQTEQTTEAETSAPATSQASA